VTKSITARQESPAEQVILPPIINEFFSHDACRSGAIEHSMNAYITLSSGVIIPAGSDQRGLPVTTDIRAISAVHNTGILEVNLLNENGASVPTFPGAGKRLKLGYAFSVTEATGATLTSVQSNEGKYMQLTLPSRRGGRLVLTSDVIPLESVYLYTWFSYEGLAEPIVATVRLVY